MPCSRPELFLLICYCGRVRSIRFHVALLSSSRTCTDVDYLILDRNYLAINNCVPSIANSDQQKRQCGDAMVKDLDKKKDKEKEEIRLKIRR